MPLLKSPRHSYIELDGDDAGRADERSSWPDERTRWERVKQHWDDLEEQKRSPVLRYAVAATSCLLALWILTSAIRWTTERGSWKLSSSAPPHVDRVLIRLQSNNEGIGSLLQRIKGSIIIAEHAANATFLLAEAESEHGYSASRLLNQRIFNASLPVGKTCMLSHYLPLSYRQDLILGLCDGSNSQLQAADDLRSRLDPCAIIVDDTPLELFEGFNGCIKPFLRQRLGGIDERRLGSTKVLGLGIHIRWGDAAGEGTSSSFRGSMSTEHINIVIGHARKRYSQLDIRVVMENHSQSVLEQLNFKDFTLVDSGDPMADLHALADNDLLVLGSSSYGALSHLLAPPRGLSIVEGGDEGGKYLNTGREVICTRDYNPASLDALPRILGW